jgi:hypothetical protein
VGASLHRSLPTTRQPIKAEPPARRSSSRVSQRWRSRTFFCSRAKNDSMAALSPLNYLLVVSTREATDPLCSGRAVSGA